MPDGVTIAQLYYVWVFYSTTTKQYYYYSSLKNTIPAGVKDIAMHFTVKAHSEHDAIARCLMEGYTTRERM